MNKYPFLNLPVKILLLFILVLLFTTSPRPSRKEIKLQRIYYNTDNYKYDDDLIIRKSKDRKNSSENPQLMP